MRKRTVILTAAAAAVLACGGWYVSQYGFTVPARITLPWGYSFETGIGSSPADSGTAVYVESVAAITGQGAVGITDRFTGSVETQETKGITFDTNRKLAEIFVEEGDEVKAGDPLFSYDTEEMKQKLQECDLELEEMANTLQSLYEQLEQLRVAQSKAKAEEQPAYNIQVASGENSIRRQEYNIAAKQLERSQMEKDLQNSVITSDMDGIVKKIDRSKTGSSGGSGYDSYGYSSGSGSSDAFITLLAAGDYRIKGSASEMSIWSLQVGQPVIVRPRADETRVYHGMISKVDTEPAEENNNNGIYYGDSSGETVSKYNFYVDLEENMDLMLGQHVLIEPDEGQDEEKEGLWLPSYYIGTDEEGSFVWKCGEDGTIVKARPEFGEQNEELYETQILDGLDITDYIAFPDDTVEEGARAIRPGDADPAVGEMDMGY